MGRCRKTSRLRLDTHFECDRFLDSLYLLEQSGGCTKQAERGYRHAIT
jgi:hypothetical protein